MPGACAPYRTTGKYSTSGWYCAVTVADGARREELSIDTPAQPDLSAHRGAGQVLGATGIYWHAGVMLARWRSALLLVLVGGGPLVGSLLLLIPLRRIERLAGIARARAYGGAADLERAEMVRLRR